MEEEKRWTLIGLPFTWSAGEKDECWWWGGQNVARAARSGPSVGVFIEGRQSEGERKGVLGVSEEEQGRGKKEHGRGGGGGAHGQRSGLKLTRRTENSRKE